MVESDASVRATWRRVGNLQRENDDEVSEHHTECRGGTAGLDVLEHHRLCI